MREEEKCALPQAQGDIIKIYSEQIKYITR